MNRIMHRCVCVCRRVHISFCLLSSAWPWKAHGASMSFSKWEVAIPECHVSMINLRTKKKKKKKKHIKLNTRKKRMKEREREREILLHCLGYFFLRSSKASLQGERGREKVQAPFFYHHLFFFFVPLFWGFHGKNEAAYALTPSIISFLTDSPKRLTPLLLWPFIYSQRRCCWGENRWKIPENRKELGTISGRCSKWCIVTAVTKSLYVGG